MSIRSLLKVQKRYPSTANSINSHLSVRFSSLLEPFLSNVSEFSEFMRNNDIVLSGSMALKFIDPSFVSHWSVQPRDLDFYAPRFVFNSTIDYLVIQEGYAIVKQIAFLDASTENDSQSHYRPWNDQIVAITTLRNGSRSIDVVCSRTQSPLLPLLRFHSTIVMNALTPDMLFIAYRDLTFANQSLINPSRKLTEDARVKWASRGYALLENSGQRHPDHHCRSSSFCPHTVRLSNDNGTLLWLFCQNLRTTVPRSTWGVLWRLGGSACHLGLADSVELLMPVENLFDGCTPELSPDSTNWRFEFMFCIRGTSIRMYDYL